jgi:hypothetical protein
MKKPRPSESQGTSSKEKPSDNNKHIRQALIEYCRFPHPQQFAVMLNGLWGSGKTHFIHSILADLTGTQVQGIKALYVSLYGVTNPSEISDQLFQQIHPILGHKLTRLAGKVLSSAIKTTTKLDIHGATEQVTASLPTFDLSSIMNSSKGRIIVFDDFERAVMSPIEVLGYINPLVEHDDCKVLIIADETHIGDQADYKVRKEKTVGRTFLFRADADTAFDAFVKLIDDPKAQAFLQRSKHRVVEVFANSSFDNLRLLQRALWDFEHLWKALTTSQRQNEEAIQELLSLVCAAAIELRAGSLKAEEFRRDDMGYHLALEGKQESAVNLSKIIKKYPSVKFSSTLINPPDLIDLIINGRLSASNVQDQLNQHPSFTKHKNLASWRALWFVREAPQTEHTKIVDRFKTDFHARTFREEGEVNHVIGLALWLSEIGIRGWASSTIVNKIKRYVDVIYKGSATVNDLSNETRFDFKDGAYGLGYLSRGNPEFAELMRYHDERRSARRRRGYPTLAADLLKQMTRDSEAFYHDVCFNTVGPSRFARLGVLKHIPAKKFAAVVAAASGLDQRNLLMALSTRYEQVGAEQELQEEVPWLRQVKEELEKKAAKLPVIARFTFSALIAEYVTKTLPAIESRLPRQAPKATS